MHQTFSKLEDKLNYIKVLIGIVPQNNYLIIKNLPKHVGLNTTCLHNMSRYNN